MRRVLLIVLLAGSCNGTPPAPTPVVPVGAAQPFAGIAPALERGEAPKTTSVLVMRAGTHYNQKRAMHDQTASLLERYILPDLASSAISALTRSARSITPSRTAGSRGRRGR